MTTVDTISIVFGVQGKASEESLNTLGLGGLGPEQIGDSATPLQDAEDLQDEDDAVFASSDIRYR